MPIRGGTDGSRLTELGLPTPNVFTGMQEIHGPLEWVSLQDMARRDRGVYQAGAALGGGRAGRGETETRPGVAGRYGRSRRLDGCDMALLEKMPMEIKVQDGDVLQAESDLAVFATFEDAPLPSEVADLLEPNDYRGRANQTLLLYPRGAVAPRRLLLVGLGNARKRPPRRSDAQRRPPSKKPGNCKWPG